MGKLLCEKKLRDVWCRNESVRAEIGHILQTHAATSTKRVEVCLCRAISGKLFLEQKLIHWLQVEEF